MKATLNSTLLKQVKLKATRYDIWDDRLKGFHLRVHPSGKKTYRVMYRRGKIVSLGDGETLKPAEAREKARIILGETAQGKSLTNKSRIPTLRQYVASRYEQHFLIDSKGGKKEINRLKKHFFPKFGDIKLHQIAPIEINDWIQERAKKVKNDTINRDVTTLKAALNQAVKWKLIEANPIADTQPLESDESEIVRYLSKEEERSLLKTVAEYEADLNKKRDSGNAWREERKYETLPEIKHPIKPIVTLALNTGARRNEIFSLTWEKIDFHSKTITFLGKNRKLRRIPMNSLVEKTLIAWKESNCQVANNLVFPGRTGNKLNNLDKSWKTILEKAEISNFRWHDMRHHFASWLVMSGVDLNTVRELMGHSSIKMTLRYAHLAPEHKANAVEALLNSDSQY